MWCAGCERYFAENCLASNDFDGHHMIREMERKAYMDAGLLAHSKNVQAQGFC